MEQIDKIIDYLKKCAEDKTPIAPSDWISCALNLNSLRGELDDSYYLLEHEIASQRANLAADSVERSVASIRLIVEAKAEFHTMRRLEAKIKQVEEFIRLAKKQSTLKDSEMRGY